MQAVILSPEEKKKKTCPNVPFLHAMSIKISITLSQQCLSSFSTSAEHAFARKRTILSYKHHESDLPTDLTDSGQLHPAKSQQSFFRSSISRKCDCVILKCSDSPGTQCPQKCPYTKSTRAEHRHCLSKEHSEISS